MAKCPICTITTTAYGDHVRTAHPLACSEVRNFFEQYLARTLEVPDEERVICHLGECKSCSKEYANFCSQKRLTV